MKRTASAAAVVLGFALPVASATAAQAAKSEARKIPLQRCDQASGKAQLECLHKAREGILEARRKREAAQAADEQGNGKGKGKEKEKRATR